MSVVIIGECRGVTSETVQWSGGDDFVAQTIHVESTDGSERTDLRVGKDFDPKTLPAKGDNVAVECGAVVKVARSGRPYAIYTAWRRLTVVERVAFNRTGPAAVAG